LLSSFIFPLKPNGFSSVPCSAKAPLPTPFFTPQHPIASFRGHKDASQIGVRIFNAQPGYGIAFIRAVGLVHDYPRSASKFLLQETVDRKVGNGDGMGMVMLW